MQSTQFAFRSLVDALETADDEKAISAAAERTARRLGFRWFAYLGFAEPAMEVLSSYPNAWAERYLAYGYEQVDPVVLEARHGAKAFYWDSRAYAANRSPAERRFMNEAEDFGICSGVTVPIRGGHGRFAMFTLAGEQDDASFAHAIAADIETIQLMGLYFHAHVYAKLQLRLARDGVPYLSNRERQCLTWIARGKTMQDVAEILGISRRTVLFHLENARVKLKAATLSHAVAEAARLRLISY